jgi:predicted nucleotidyltransferase
MKGVLEPVLAASADALETLGLRYAVVGGLAVSAWGAFRATRDVDLYAELPGPMRAPVHRELVARGFDVPAMEEELRRFGVFRSRFVASGVFLDIFSAEGPLGEAILARRMRSAIEGRSVWTISAEDLAVLKVFSDRARDQEDVVKLVALLGRRLDRSYVADWAKRLDESLGGSEVSERWVAAVERAKALRRRRR